MPHSPIVKIGPTSIMSYINKVGETCLPPPLMYFSEAKLNRVKLFGTHNRAGEGMGHWGRVRGKTGNLD